MVGLLIAICEELAIWFLEALKCQVLGTPNVFHGKTLYGGIQPFNLIRASAYVS